MRLSPCVRVCCNFPDEDEFGGEVMLHEGDFPQATRPLNFRSPVGKLVWSFNLIVITAELQQALPRTPATTLKNPNGTRSIRLAKGTSGRK